MHFSRFISALLFVSLAGARAPAAQHGPFPDAAVFAQRVRQAIEEDERLEERFSYIEKRRDIRVSRLGKVEIGPERTFEVYPSPVRGGTYKRLIAIDGKPLTPEELAERDREHQEHREKLAARLARESATERAERQKKEAEEQRERAAILDDAFAVYQPAFLGRETIDGHDVLVVSLTPRDDARVTTREGEWMKQFGGRAWIAEADHRIVRLELRARDDVTIGWGLIGRLHEGSRLVYTRRKFDEAWLPSQLIFDASGRTLLFRKFDLDLVTTYFGYKRVEEK